ncbi:hypothetical protein RvY_18742 [Ramazzottius varieornatus]|uniref:Uncharacterized protein n=1 Tax=Ramazzottius varieornatus TaxID=947166 RepID=A0A1D1W9V7_RAMVA|nr:hypothetical protein RvY_18742 [Ramazzottius varieornatus]
MFLSHKAQAFPEESAMPQLPPLPPSAPPMPPVSDETGLATKQPKARVAPKSGLVTRHGRIAKSKLVEDLNSAEPLVVSPRRLQDEDLVISHAHRLGGSETGGKLGGVEKYRRAQTTSMSTAEAQRLLNRIPAYKK